MIPMQKLPYFQTIRRTPQIWEENRGASYSPNVAYLACSRGVAGGGLGRVVVERGFFLFSSSKT